METKIEIQNKSTKEVILEYLKQNHGREIAVHEISEKFNFKLARISNAIKELELTNEIKVERRPIKKGKYTVISLPGDTITEFATHERAIEIPEEHENENISLGEIPIQKIVDLLLSPKYEQNQLEILLKPYYKNYYELTCGVIKPLMNEVGLLWQTQKLNVGDEHLISARVEKFIAKQILTQQPGSNKKTIILAPAEDEHHTLALKLLELLLLERGHRVINLAYTIDALSLVSFIKKGKINPQWILFSLTISSYQHNLRMNIRIIKEELQMANLNIAIGGQGIKNVPPNEFKEADKIIKTDKELYDFIFSL